MALDTTTSQSPQPNVFTKEDNDEDLWNSISVPKSILENRHSGKYMHITVITITYLIVHNLKKKSQEYCLLHFIVYSKA